MSASVWVLLCSAVLMAVAWRRTRWSPLTLSLVLWLVIAATAVLNPLGLAAVSGQTALIVCVGLSSLTLASAALRPDDQPVKTVPQGESSVALPRLFVSSALAALMVLIGVIAFRNGVSSATGVDIGSLTPSQIRAAQTGSARGGGLLSLLQAANALLGCLGVYGALRYSRLWWLLVVLALGASLQTPARLTTLSLVVQVATFYLYMRRSFPRRPGAMRLRRPPTVVLVGVGIAMVAFFDWFGSRLGKSQLLATYFPHYDGPSWLLSPVVYFTGGLSSLSEVLHLNVDPAAHPTSIFALARFWQVVDPTYTAPTTMTAFIPIPVPFNVYTGFGQIYLDFGVLGVVVLTALLGLVAAVSHHRASRGNPEWAWVSAVVAGLLLTMPQAYRLFYLDIDFQFVVGFLMFWMIRRSKASTRPGRGRPSVAVARVRGIPRSRAEAHLGAERLQ